MAVRNPDANSNGITATEMAFGMSQGELVRRMTLALGEMGNFTDEFWMDRVNPFSNQLRCRVTGNPCGTDMVPDGVPCLCPPCVERRR